MNAGGVLLVLVGVWVGCQVFGGDALGRLKIAGGGPTQSDIEAAGGSLQAPGPYTGVPYQGPGSDVKPGA